MPKWSPFPFVRITAVFALGILVEIAVEPISFFTTEVLICVALTGYVILFLFRNRYDLRRVTGVFGLGAIFLLGYAHTMMVYNKEPGEAIVGLNGTNSAYEVVLTTTCSQTNSGWRTEGDIISVRLDKRWLPLKDKIILYVDAADSLEPFDYGDEVLVRGKPSLVPPPFNPGGFDYRAYLAYRNIHYRDFIDRKDILIISKGSLNPLVSLSYVVRKSIKAQLEKFVPGQQEFAVAEALLLGVKDELGNDLKNAYATAGVMHVLAVSGLHVGILYWMLLLFLKPIKRKRNGRIISAIVVILVLWFYAFVTGLVPSVLRAVTMFSFFTISNASYRETNVYNILAASAFILLIINPMIIMTEGFQLSYVAVLGILYFYPKVYSWWNPGVWILDKAWQIVAVSIAAQLSTTPLVLYYFHQFPIWFLLSNLVIVPAAFGTVVLGFATLAFSLVPWVAAKLGYLLAMIIHLMNRYVDFISSLPWNSFHAQINIVLCLLLFLLILFVAALFEQRRFRYLVFAFCTLVLVTGISLLRTFRTLNETSLIVYRIPNHSAFDIFIQGACYQFQDPSIDSALQSFTMTPARSIKNPIFASKLMDQPFCGHLSCGNLIVWKNIRILHLQTHPRVLPQDWQFDYLVVSNDAIESLDDIWKRINAKWIILDSSNSYWNTDKLMREGAERHMQVYAVLQNGAFAVKL